MEQKLKNNIILIGFMGSGKTSVGERLAERISFRFCDSDQLLEQKAGASINHIFSVHGEEYFRDMETQLLQELSSSLNQTVLSTGGGLPIREQNLKLLKELGFVVFLKASKKTTVDRLRGDTSRPLLKGEELELKVERMLGIRTPIYEKAAHKVITTDHKTIDEIAELILSEFMKQK